MSALQYARLKCSSRLSVSALSSACQGYTTAFCPSPAAPSPPLPAPETAALTMTLSCLSDFMLVL